MFKTIIRKMQFGVTSRNSIKRTFLLLFIPVAGILIALWWLNQTGHQSVNLLANPDFEEELTGWETFQARGKVALKPAVDDPDNTVLALSVPSSDQLSWVAVKKRLDSLTSDQTYRLKVNYRLPHEGQSPAKVVIRVVQVDQAGTPVQQDEVSDPDRLITGLDEQAQLAWTGLNHSFTVDKQTAAVELYIALTGRQAALVEVDHLALTLQGEPGRHSPVQTGLIILLVALFLGAGISFIRRTDSRQARMIRKWGAVVVVNLVLFFLLAELIALGLYFFRGDGLFYTNQKQYSAISTGEETLPTTELAENLTTRRFHPFFGFVVQPGADERFNNYGFISPYSYPFVKTSENQYVIGIFGGSVAQIFATEENQAYFIHALKQDQFFKDKEIVILNFAAGAYKQPQQLIVLNYFLSIGQQIDLVINIDGFNEVAMSYINYQNGVDLSMPVSFVMLPLMNLTNRTTPSPATIESLAKINRLKDKLNDLAQTINHNRSAFAGFVLEQYYAFTLARYRTALASLEQTKSNAATSLIYLNPVEEKLDETAVFNQIAQTWVNSSVTMHEVLTNRNIPYFHFLQPNQYYSDRTFSPTEAQIALNPDQVYRAGAEKGYPFLVERFDTLVQNGVNFHSGLDIFDEETGAVYGDDCCHYNERGNQILADFIAGTILEALPKSKE